MFTNLLKATIATALLPVAAAVDVVMMPIDAVNDDELASRSKAMAGSVSDNIKSAKAAIETLKSLDWQPPQKKDT